MTSVVNLAIWLITYFLNVHQCFSLNQSLYQDDLAITHYELSVTTFQENSTFKGTVTIELTTKSYRHNFTLSEDDFEYEEVIVSKELKNGTSEVAVWEKNSDKLVILSPLGMWQPGISFIKITYRGNMTDIKSGKGFIVHKYIDNETDMSYSMYLGNGGGRSLMPCFDEPQLQAPFSIRLYTENKLGVSNALPDSSADGLGDSKWRLLPFIDTDNMSTYQVGLATADLGTNRLLADNSSNHPYIINLYGRIDALRPSFVEGYVLPLILTLQNILGVWDHRANLSIMAFPGFGPDIVHNPGLAFCREDEIFVEEGLSNVKSREHVFKSFVDIMIRQRFSQATRDVWIPQGISIYLQYTVGSRSEDFKEWGLDQTFITDVLQEALLKDDGSRMVFSKKFAVILKMIEEIESVPVIDKSLKELVSVRGLLSEAHLLSAFNQPTDTKRENKSPSVTEILKSWISQPGHPVILINTYVNQSYMTISQISSTDNASAWPVILKHTTQKDLLSGDPAVTLWANPENGNTTLPLDDSMGWVLFGYLQSGYFRVNYDQRNWKLITKQLLTNHTLIPIVTRSQLLDDAFQLAWSGNLDYAIAFNLSLYLINELDYVPWLTAIRNFEQLIRLFRGTKTGADLQHYAVLLFSGYFSVKHRVAGDDHCSGLEKLLATEWACRWGSEECIKFAKAYFSMWLSSYFNFPAEYKPTALCVAVASDDSAFFDLMDSMTQSNNAADRKVFLSALACTRDNHHRLALLRTIFTDQQQNILEHNEKMYLLEEMMRVPGIINDVISFIATNYDAALLVVGEIFIDEMWVLLGRNILVEEDLAMVQTLIGSESLPQNLQQGFNTSLSTALISQTNAERLAPLLPKAIANVLHQIVQIVNVDSTDVTDSNVHSSSNVTNAFMRLYLLSFLLSITYCSYFRF